MKLSYVKRDKKLNEAAVQISEFVRYAFTPSFGFVMLVGAQCFLSIVTILLYRFQPLVAVVIFCGYTGLFGMVMIVSVIAFRKYKSHYNSVFKK